MNPIQVLVVDDDEDIVQFVTSSLSAGGLRVGSAKSGEEAIEHIKSGKPELIIADVIMPGMNGYELCRKVRAMGNDDIPFIFCSTRGALPERIMGLKIGADDYIVKPVNPYELLLKVKAHLSRNRKLRAMKNYQHTPQGFLNGDLGRMPVPDVLQVVALMGLEDACAELLDPDGAISGEIRLQKKVLVHARSGRMIGLKAFHRLLDMKKGSFRVLRKPFTETPTLSGELGNGLLDALTRIDAYHSLREQLGSLFTLQNPVPPAENDLDHKSKSVLELIGMQTTLDQILDASDLPDCEIVNIILDLLKKGIVKVGTDPVPAHQ